MDKEIWKPVIGYEGLYEVSSFGRIKSLKYGKKGIEKIRKLGIQKKGYSVVGLTKFSIKKTFIVSRLVAIHFIHNPLNLPCVCHKDETLIDGALYNGKDNLFWGTYLDNSQDMWKKGRSNNHLQINHPMKGKFGKNHNSSKIIIQYTTDGIFIREWQCIADVQRELGINQASIVRCCRFKNKTAGGFIWKYL